MSVVETLGAASGRQRSLSASLGSCSQKTVQVFGFLFVLLNKRKSAEDLQKGLLGYFELRLPRAYLESLLALLLIRLRNIHWLPTVCQALDWAFMVKGP